MDLDLRSFLNLSKILNNIEVIWLGFSQLHTQLLSDGLRLELSSSSMNSLLPIIYPELLQRCISMSEDAAIVKIR
jgi:hypothetical protein